MIFSNMIYLHFSHVLSYLPDLAHLDYSVNSLCRVMLLQSDVYGYTVKPLKKGHPREGKTLTFIDKWSLYGGFFREGAGGC